MARRTRAARAPVGLDAMLASKEMIVVCGSGGTGKTTLSAALGAMAATRLGARVLVLTVDPARRLATALGLGSAAIGGATPGSEVRVDPVLLAAADPSSTAATSSRGELWMAMLDTKAGWDDLIRRHAPDAALREQVLANPLYQNITGRFVHSHDYLAMERLHELHASGRFDLVIIDTPPSRNALDLLDAPGRMKEFFGSRLLRWLTVPYRSRLFTVASKPFYQVADRVLGSRFLQDIAEFFILFQTMEKGFVARADEVERLLVDPRTAFVVVSTLEAAPAYEAGFLARELQRRGMHLGAVLLNRTLSPDLRTPAAARAARDLRSRVDDPAFVAEMAAAAGVESGDARTVLTEVSERFHDVAVVASREAERRAELESIGALTVSAPALARDVADLASLVELGRHLLDAR
ncbi:MAG: ArsA family ATPase [Acidimicrobiales bacterium]|nr:ArsA family ATPase [Acidimicrobiales bacterium]MCB9393006.1 ArsA family ATPase [Acidimicrobiaceae bacterium]